MSSPSDTMDRIVHKLLLLTKSGTILWSPDEVVERRTTSLVGRAYTGDYKGRRFALYEYRYKHYYDEDEWAWTFLVTLEVVDRNGTMLWECQSNEVQGELRDLINEVRAKYAGIEELFADLMDEEVK